MSKDHWTEKHLSNSVEFEPGSLKIESEGELIQAKAKSSVAKGRLEIALRTLKTTELAY